MGRNTARPWLLLIPAFLMLAGRVGAEPHPGLRELWPQVMAATESGDARSRDQKVTELLRVGSQLGIQRFPLYARSAASLALQSQRAGNGEVATWAMATALRLDPRLPDVEFSAADLAWARHDPASTARHLLAGIAKVFSNYRTRVIARSNLVLAFVATLFATAAIFALVLFFRYSRIAAHDLKEWLSTRLAPGIATVGAVALLFLPIFLWFGPVWLLVYWLMLFFGYATVREKILIGVLLVIVAAIPPTLDWNSFQVTLVDSPAVEAAVANVERSYDAESLRRLRDLLQVFPDDARLHLLLGNLDMQDGDDQEGWLRYQKAIDLNPRLAGAHLNLGNLRFLSNDLKGAMREFELAAEADPTMAIADYNRSVASGEMYKFDEQGSFLEKAKNKDRPLVERLLAHPPLQKIVMYRMPVDVAWQMSEELARTGKAHDVYGSFATFAPGRSVQNPLTVGALAALLIAIAIWARRRGAGFAGECIKCGRTFCHRCKSAHESATYCTQCIHIYLKRDGVSLDTKRSKLADVQRYQAGYTRKKRIFTTLLPGSAQIFSGSTLTGTIRLLLFVFFVAIALSAGRLAPIASPASTMIMVLRLTAILLAVVTWLVTSIPVYRERVTG